MTINSIKWKVSILVCLLIVFSIGSYVTVTISLLRESYRANSQNEFDRAELILKEKIKSDLENISKQIQMLGFLPVLMATMESGDIVTIQDKANDFQKDLDFTSCMLVTSSKQLVFSPPRVLAQLTEDENQLIQEAFNGNATSFLTESSSQKGRISLIAAAPIGLGSLSGVIVVEQVIDRAYLDRVGQLANVKMNVDNNDGIYENTETPNSLSKKRPILGFQSKVLGEWELVKSMEEERETEREIYLFILVFSIMVLVVGFIAAYIVSYNITNPIIRLKHFVEYIVENDDYQNRSPLRGKDEIRDLSLAFNHLLEKIQEDHKQITDMNASIEALAQQRADQFFIDFQRMQNILSRSQTGLIIFDMNFKIQSAFSKTLVTMANRPLETFPNQDLFDSFFSGSILGAREKQRLREMLAGASLKDELYWSQRTNPPSDIEFQRSGGIQSYHLEWIPYFNGEQELESVALIIIEKSATEQQAFGWKPAV